MFSHDSDACRDEPHRLPVNLVFSVPRILLLIILFVAIHGFHASSANKHGKPQHGIGYRHGFEKTRILVF